MYELVYTQEVSCKLHAFVTRSHYYQRRNFDTFDTVLYNYVYIRQ